VCARLKRRAGFERALLDSTAQRSSPSFPTEQSKILELVNELLEWGPVSSSLHWPDSNRFSLRVAVDTVAQLLAAQVTAASLTSLTHMD
jgi:hypothetical protein